MVAGVFGDLATNRGGARVFLQNADGSFQPGVVIDAGVSTPAVATGDFNGDGKADFVAGGQLASSPNFIFGVSLLLGNGNGTFATAVAIPTAFGPQQVASGDYEGDAETDLIVAHY